MLMPSFAPCTYTALVCPTDSPPLMQPPSLRACCWLPGADIPVSQQILVFAGHHLKDNSQLADLGLDLYTLADEVRTSAWSCAVSLCVRK